MMLLLLALFAVSIDALQTCPDSRIPSGFSYTGQLSEVRNGRRSFHPHWRLKSADGEIQEMLVESRKLARGEPSRCCALPRRLNDPKSIVGSFCPFANDPHLRTIRNADSRWRIGRADNLIPSWVMGPCGRSNCDKKVTSVLMGGDGLACVSGFEPAFTSLAKFHGTGGDRSRTAVGCDRPSCWAHLNGYSGHLYSKTEPGVRFADVYVPPGWDAHQRPRGRDATTTFHYRQLGNERNVLLVFYHVKNYKIDRSQRNRAGSIRFGTLGGPAGDSEDYLHIHVEAHRGRSLPRGERARDRTRLFFSKIWCSESDDPIPVAAPDAPRVA